MDTATIDLRRATRRRWARALLTAGAVPFALVAGVGLAAHFTTAHGPRGLKVVAAAPYLMLASIVAVGLLLLARRWIGALLAVALVAVCASTQIRLYVAADPPKDARDVVVMTANLYLGSADPATVVRDVRRHDVDVLMLDELTTQLQDRLIAAGLAELLPHRESLPGDGGSGMGLWSRYPLADARTVPGFAMALITARIAVPGIAAAPTFVALHMPGPAEDSTRWRADMARLPGALDRLPADAAVVVGGDFNATPDTAQFRRLLRNGYRDAAEQAGAGMTRTWPANRSVPPLIAIDHVLTRGAVARSADTLGLNGSDHRAVLSRVAIPRR